MRNIIGQGDLTRSRWLNKPVRLTCGWIGGILACGWVTTQFDRFSPWVFMWLLTATLLFALKNLTWLRLENPASFLDAHWIGYLFFWPGMQPRKFFPGSEVEKVKDGNLWWNACRNLFVGMILLSAAVLTPGPWWIKGWLGMVAFSFLIHFGLFDLLAAGWRQAGVPVEKLFRCPIRARSLGEFWGNRWNLAFSTFARDLIFRPLARPWGTTLASFCVFVFSGLAHELVISVPARAGYGGPTLYFVLQGLLVAAEGRQGLRRALRDRPLWGWLWTATCVIGPVPLLFHSPFLQRVVLPFLASLGG